MLLKRGIRILKISLKLRMKKISLYRGDYIFHAISNVIFLLSSIFFWYIVTEVGFNIKGWSFSQILVYVAFSEFFYGLNQNVFSIASQYWNLIYGGTLDVQLCRPLDTRLRLIILNMDISGLLLTIVKFVVILCLAQIKLEIWKLLLGIFIVIVACITFSLLQFTISYFAFWLHKVDALTEISENLTLFNKYPLVIFPTIIKGVFCIVFPFYFFSTFSAELVLAKIQTDFILIYLIALVINLIFWWGLSNIVFRKGRRRYESING